MKILGISMGFNSSAALMIDGKIVAAQQEERFNRIKNYDTWPGKAIDSCLKIANISRKELDAVVWAGKDPGPPEYFLTKRYCSFSLKDMVDEQYNFWYPKMYENKKINFLKLYKSKIDLKQKPGKKFLNKVKKNYQNPKGLSLMHEIKYELVKKELGIARNKVFFEEHHECHAYYSVSKFINVKKNILVFTLDGSGDKGINCTVSVFRNRKLKRLFSTKNFILGRIYRHITLLLGMKWGEHEYKTMGLAPYSTKYHSDGPFEIFNKTLKIINPKNVKQNLKDCYFYFIKPLSRYRFDGIAQGVQRFAEEKILKWFKLWINKTKIYDICYSGGVSMNVKANQEASKIKKVNSFNVMGSGTDDSLSIGACYSFASKHENNIEPLNHLYLGYEINEKEINHKIKKLNKKKFKIIKKPTNLFFAKLLKRGLILGRCKGKMEFGSRALGNRSILADPTSSETIKRINEKIKSRDFWMPFAPSVLDNCSKKYFSIKKNIDYTQMTVCVDTKEYFKNKIPAVLHPADKTARVHVVKKENNPDYYHLISCFKKISGYGVVLNTSLNLHGKPIVRNVDDCLEVLTNSEIDGILIENYLILKRENNA